MKQYAAIDDTIYFWFAGNDTSGSGGDGASPAADVRLAGAAADAAPVYSPTPSLLSHVNYPAGAYEIAITASVANGFATGNTYAVFCTLAIDSQNPTGFVGSFDTKPVESNPTQIGDSAQSLTDLKDFADAGYDPGTNKVQGVVLVDTTTTNTDIVSAAAVVNEWESQSQADPTGFHVNVKEVNGTAQTANDNSADINSILGDTNELQTDWTDGGRLDLLLDACALEATVAALNNISVADIIAGIADGSYDLQEMIRIIFASVSGKSAGGGTVTITMRDAADGKDRISATVDGNGNRTAVTRDGS